MDYFIKKEENKVKKNNTMKIVIIIGIIIIPLMYSFFYLKAFWDPYGNLKTMPIALVNLDQGDGDENLGNDIIQNLQDKDVMTFDVLPEEKANTALVNQDYYAVITIPKDFTKTLNNADTKERQMATITYSPNQKSNYLASQIIAKVVTSVESELKGQISQKVVGKLTDELQEVPTKLQEISEGASQLQEGTTTLSNGLASLQTGTTSLATNYSAFHEGINSAYQGSQSLNTGISELSSGLAQLASGTNTLTSGTNALSDVTTAVNTLANGNQEFTTGITNYISGVNTTHTNVTALLNGVISYGNAHPELLGDANFRQLYGTAQAIINSGAIANLSASGNQLKASATQLNTGMQQFKSKTSSLAQLQSGASQLQKAVSKLQQGSQKLQAGSNTLTNGLRELQTHSTQLKTGIHTLQTGATTAYQGSTTLLAGNNEFKSQIENGLTDTKEKLTNLTGLDSYVKEPVTVQEEDYGKIASYGVGFAPYFMSLSLWVGGLILFVGLYYDPHDRFKILGRNASNKLLRVGLYLLIAIAQALLLGFLLKAGLGFSVTNIWLYYGSCILISLVFLSIIQCLILNFGDVGKFLAILFLVLQLAASGGTFPIETVPMFFQKIYAFMPMNYTIRLLKESLVCIDGNFALQNALILFGIFAVFTLGTVIGDRIRSHTEKQISPDTSEVS